MEEPETGDKRLVVLRCDACGDTFPVERLDRGDRPPAHKPPSPCRDVRRDEAACPSCGSPNVHEASEPLL